MLFHKPYLPMGAANYRLSREATLSRGTCFHTLVFSFCPLLLYNLHMAENMEGGLQIHGPVMSPDGKPGGPPQVGQQPEDERNPADEAEAQKYTRRESLSDELISGAETPQELYYGLRLVEKQLEESFIPPNLQERYTPPRHLSTMYERAEALALSVEEMQRLGWIQKGGYDPTSGEAKLKDRRFGAVALKTEITEKPVGRYMQQEVKYYVGTNEQRQVLERAYRRAMTELAARDILGEHVGFRLSIDNRDSLENLVYYLHSGRMPKFKASHLEALFNMPGVEELAANPENRRLGDQVEEAMFLNLVMLNSGSRESMEELLARPGAKHLIAKLAKENGMAYEDWVRKYIGDVGRWVSDYDPSVDTSKNANGEYKDKDYYKKTRDIEKTWRHEARPVEEGGLGVRGELTQWANIAAWAGEPGEFGTDDETKFIESIVGGAVGSVEASWVAASMMRAIGAYASEGYVALPNGKSHLPLGEGRFISGDDTGKFWAYMFNMKEGRKGRVSGLKDLIGKIPDMAMNLFDWAQVKIEEPDEKGKLNMVQRSIWDAWLGTAGGRPIKDLLTGRDTGKRTVEEPYHRMGDLNFKSLEREFHGTFTVMQWLMGNKEGPTGVFLEGTNVEEFEFRDFSLNKLKKIWKYIDIVMNPVVLTKGSTHLYELGTETMNQISTFDLVGEGAGKVQMREYRTKNTETIKRRYFKNLMAARIRSSAFAIGIMPKKVEVYSTLIAGPDFLEVPAANLVELYVKEALKPYPQDESEVIDHYIDDITRLGGVDKAIRNVGAVRNTAKSWLNPVVGRVTGKAS